MHPEYLLETMGHLDPALIEEAGRAPRRRRLRWVRPALAAACLCLVLVGCAVVANVVWGIRFTTATESSIQISVEGLRRFSLDEVGEEVRDIIENEAHDDTLHGRVYLTWGAAEEHLGVPLIRNDLLAQAEAEYPLRNAARLDVWMMPNVEGVFVIVSTRYYYKETDVCVIATLNVENDNQPEDFEAYLYREDELLQYRVEDYTMPDGSSAVITAVEREFLETYYIIYRATFMKDGIMYDVSFDVEEELDEGYIDLMKEILAAFY